MGLVYNTSVVRDGLVLYLDAANVKSYLGTGTSWADLSGKGNHGTINGMSHSVSNNGYFALDGTNDVCNIPNSTSLNPTYGLTIESWVNFAENGQDFIFEKGNVNTQYSLFSHGEDIVFRTYHVGDGSYNTFSITKTVAGVSSGNWYHIVGSWDGSTKRIFINGVQKSSTSKTGNLVSTTLGASVGRFGGTTNGYWFNGKIAKVSVYERGLTSEEILQNFEAHRGRYGI